MRGIKIGTIVGLSVMGCVGLLKNSYALNTERYEEMLQNNVSSIQQVINLFPKSPNEIAERCKASLAIAQKDFKELLSLSHEKRNFDNTIKAFDELSRKFSIACNPIHVLEMLHPDEAMRNAAHEAILTMQDFAVDAFMNPALYAAFEGMIREGSLAHANGEKLSSEEAYFLSESMKDFKRNGFDLPSNQFDQVKQIKKELSQLGTEFQAAIAKDNRFIAVAPEDLAGVSDDLLQRLEKIDDGKLKVGVDYPTYFEVMGHCKNGQTRKLLLTEFQNRAYPENMERLKTIISKRDALAQLLHFPSYAHLDIDPNMAETPERAYAFIYQLIDKARQKELLEHRDLMNDLPEGVELNERGQFFGWDLEYIKESYKKKHFSMDAREVAEYFPVDKTVEGIFAIYQKFLNVDFERVPVQGLWDKEVICISIKDRGTGKQRGYVILDLYPRPNKYSHACCAELVPSLYSDQNGKRVIAPAACMVIANFPKATPDKPALFKHSDVETFFHEFGHAMHYVLGTTKLASCSGFAVKYDFVEMPSQMFEEWMWDKDMLKQVSSHYLTGEPLSDSLIDTMISLKKFDSGAFLRRQAYLSLISLEYFKPGAEKDTQAIQKELFEKYCSTIAYNPNAHMQASFGHLIGYGAKYYGYMWSKVFALDLFNQVKQVGLLDAGIGKQFVDKVLGKGGSADPNDLLQDFLGREPTQDAFFEDMGLSASQD